MPACSGTTRAGRQCLGRLRLGIEQIDVSQSLVLSVYVVLLASGLDVIP